MRDHTSKMKDPAFMPKAMGLRTAVTSGTDAEIAELLGECFALSGDSRRESGRRVACALPHVVAVLRAGRKSR